MFSTHKALTLTALLITTWGVRAQDTPPTDRLAVSLSRTVFGTAGFDDSTGEFGVKASTLKAENGAFVLKYDHQRFDWDSSNTLPFSAVGTPWRDLHFLEASIKISDTINEDWKIQYLLGVGSGFEKETDDSFSLHGGFAFMRKWDDVCLFAGVIGAAHQEVDGVIIPILGVVWRQGQPGWSAAVGFPATEVRYGLSKEFSVALGFLADIGRPARLSDDSMVVPGGYARLEGGGVELSAKWVLLDGLELQLGVGAIGGREMTLFDTDGDELNDYDLDDTWCGSLSLTMRF